MTSTKAKRNCTKPQSFQSPDWLQHDPRFLQDVCNPSTRGRSAFSPLLRSHSHGARPKYCPVLLLPHPFRAQRARSRRKLPLYCRRAMGHPRSTSLMPSCLWYLLSISKVTGHDPVENTQRLSVTSQNSAVSHKTPCAPTEKPLTKWMCS